MAQCPSCQTQFPSHPASAEPGAARQGESASAEPTPELAAASYDLGAPTPREKAALWPGVRWGWMGLFVLFALLRLLFRSGGDRPDPAQAVQIREAVKAFEERKIGRDGFGGAEDFREEMRGLQAPRDAEEFRPLFDELRRDFREGDGRRLASHFDVDRMAEELMGVNPAAKPGLVRTLERSLPALLEKQAPVMAWSSMRIVAVTRPDDDNEALVETSLGKAEGGTREVRWWLVRRAGGWRVYDMKDLETGKKFSPAAGLPDAEP